MTATERLGCEQAKTLMRAVEMAEAQDELAVFVGEGGVEALVNLRATLRVALAVKENA